MRIEKRSYSRSPWRLISDDGREVVCSLLDGEGNVMASGQPVCGNTKQEVVTFALRKLEQLFEENADLRKSRDIWQSLGTSYIDESKFNVCA